MKKFRRLNRKGFTLIELLAVIVILAVIMVIASTSVLSSMNSSRKKSLLNSAQSAKDNFDIAYAEYSVNASNGIMGVKDISPDADEEGGDPVITNLLSGTVTSLSYFKDALDINDTDYDLSKSYVYFDYSKSTFKVCMTARNTGNFYVAAAASTKTEPIGDETVGGKEGYMWACSNQTHSWTN